MVNHRKYEDGVVSKTEVHIVSFESSWRGGEEERKNWLLTLLSFFLRVNSKRSGARGIPGTLYNLPPVSARVRSCIFGLFRNECFLFVFGELKLMLRLR